MKVAPVVKNPLPVQVKQEPWVRSLGRKDPLEKAMAMHPSILALENLMHRGAWRATAMGLTEPGAAEAP